MPFFKVTGRVVKCSDAGSKTLAFGSIIKEAANEQELRDRWFRDMRIAFPQGPDYDVELFCTVEPVESDDVLTVTAPLDHGERAGRPGGYVDSGSPLDNYRSRPAPEHPSLFTRVTGWVFRFVLAFSASIIVGTLLGQAFGQ